MAIPSWVANTHFLFRKNTFYLAVEVFFFMKYIIPKDRNAPVKMIKEKNDELADLPDASWFFRLSRKRFLEAWKDLNLGQRSVMLLLWLYAGKKNECYPSERKISEDLNANRKTIGIIIKKLEMKKYIKIEKRVGQRGKYNHYFLLK